MGRSWTEEEKSKLKDLVESQKYTYPEIAEILGRSRGVCQQKADYMGLKNGVYRTRITKHAHLREKLLKYYLNHSAEECQRKFNLTPSEFKSCLIYAYRDPKLKHLRKETRRHDSWSIDEIKFLLKHAGIRPRKWISRKLNRGGVYAVKESLCRLNLNSKHLNGMPIKWLEVLIGYNFYLNTIKTKAGPTGCRGEFQFRIIPWVTLDRILKDIRIDPNIKACIRVMAKFQRWVFETDSENKIVSEIQRSLGTRV